MGLGNYCPNNLELDGPVMMVGLQIYGHLGRGYRGNMGVYRVR